MSSNYSVLCLSHDPAIIVHAPGYNRPEQAEEAIRDGIDGHTDCDLMIGRYSYPLVGLGCPRSADQPDALRPEVLRCYHGSTMWTDKRWLLLLAAAYESDDPAMQDAVRVVDHGCLPWERLRRLRVELGFGPKPTCDCPPTAAGLTLCARCPGRSAESARVQREIDGKLTILNAMDGEASGA